MVMTEDLVSAATAALEGHDAFDTEALRDNYGIFSLTTTPFDAAVRISADGSRISFRVSVETPTLNAVVRGEEVAPVVQEGWFETFERRVSDIAGVTKGDIEPPTVSIDEATENVEVEAQFTTDHYPTGISDAKAIIDYIEGTYVQGIIPGYEYREPASCLLDRAHDTANHGHPP